jgi:hypothetical protein
MNFKEIRYGGVEWIQLTPDSVQWRDLVNMVVDFRVALVINCSRRTLLFGVACR